MNLILKIKRRLFREIYSLFHPPYGKIFALHRVVAERSQLDNNRNLEITPAFLEQTILKYKSAGYRFVSLDDVQQQVESRKRCKQKFVCFTLDDGFADNYEQAYPVFKKHNCPFAIYVTTDFPDKKALMWWLHLENIVLENEKIRMNGKEFNCSDLKKKNQIFNAFTKYFYPDAEAAQNAMKKLLKENESVLRCDLNMLTLSWQQIVEMAADPLCTIGAHTVSHPALTALSDEEIKKELSDGKKKIEDRIKKPVKHFAYPYGYWDNRVARLVMKHFSTAVLFCPRGFVGKGAKLDRLNRIDLVEK